MQWIMNSKTLKLIEESEKMKKNIVVAKALGKVANIDMNDN
jgi:hypothetical protein